MAYIVPCKVLTGSSDQDAKYQHALFMCRLDLLYHENYSYYYSRHIQQCWDLHNIVYWLYNLIIGLRSITTRAVLHLIQLKAKETHTKSDDTIIAVIVEGMISNSIVIRIPRPCWASFQMFSAWMVEEFGNFFQCKQRSRDINKDPFIIYHSG